MRSLICLLMSILSFSTVWTQGVKIGTTEGDPHPSAILELESDQSGFLPPRVTTAQRNAISNPAVGLMVLNTDTNCMEYYRGNSLGWYSMCPQLPIVTTNSVNPVLSASAESGGYVASDGGATVTVRGICWSTSPGPTLADYFTSDGVGVGGFTSILTNLLPETTYYIRAYATNSAGTAYGNTMTLITPGIPTVDTGVASGIYAEWFTINGEALTDGASSILSRGFCYSTSPLPTLNDGVVTAGVGLGSFSSTINDLTYSTEYKVRAFASNNMFTGYGEEITVSTNTTLLYNTIGSHSWTVPEGITEVEVLVVAGGGAGGGSNGPVGLENGHHNGGGGGAGGVIYTTNHSVTPSETIPISVGAGGTPVTVGPGGNGQSSSFGALVALGGGGGGEYGQNGSDGGSGGGGGRDGGAGGLGTPGQGNDGGTGDSGGGGGAGGPSSGLDGGSGLPFSITGSTMYYGGGGGGSGSSSDGGLGGIGGGGYGRNPLSLAENAQAGAPNTGGGGGGCGLGFLPGAGGSGVVIVKW